jgi:hypothetical protein
MGNPCGSLSWVGWGWMDMNGDYTIEGLPAGSYFLQASSNGNHISEWWASSGSTAVCDDAEPVEVLAEETVSGYNFQLDPGAQISGTVYEADGSTPVTSGYVEAYTGDPCGSLSWVGWGYSDTSGNYTIEGLPAGTYFLQANSYGNHISEWWASPESTTDCAQAQPVEVLSEEAVSGYDFQLDPGAQISGTVYEADGTTPVTDGYVEAYTGDPCGSLSWVSWGYTDMSGNYTLEGLPAGTYFLQANSYGNHISEWWASPESTTDCAQAQPVEVLSEETVSGYDFQLGSKKIMFPIRSRNGQTVISTGRKVDFLPAGYVSPYMFLRYCPPTS